MTPFKHMFLCIEALRRLVKTASGNVAATFAISAVPVIFALGMTVDYGYAVRVRARMNAAADAAALSAVTATSMQGSTTDAKAAATSIFNAQVNGISRLNYDPSQNLTVTVTDQIVNSQRQRTAVVTYTASTTNVFGSFLSAFSANKKPAIPIGGTATATANTSPNIDFYLMLDTSPSMAIPSSQDGINQMVALTKYQDSGSGCAFACHEASPALESGSAKPTAPIFGNQGCPDDPQKRPGPCLDNYQLAINAGIAVRFDLVKQAVVNLVDTAQSTASATGAAYQLAGYTFDATTQLAFSLQKPTALTKVAASNNVNMLVVDHENSNNGDQNTVFDDSGTTKGAFTTVQAAMNAANSGKGAGSGTNTTGDRPQQVLMIVTDGVADEPFNGSRNYNPLGGNTNTATNTNSICSAIKNNSNVRIAILYLVYNPLPMKNGSGGSSWYALHVDPIQSDLAPTLKSCASPGLYYEVNTGGDVNAAMTSLFQSAVKSAHLTN